MNDLQRRQVEETLRREDKSKAEWALQNAEEAGRITLFRLDDEKNVKLHQLKEKVADLCDLQPTPASMVRPPRKEMLSNLRKELSTALQDIESELDAMGGSVSEMSIRSKAAKSTASTTAKSTVSTKTAKSAAPSVAGSTKSLAPAPA